MLFRSYLADHLGSTRALVSTGGVILGTITYDSFGKPLETTGTIDTRFLYTGRDYDADTELYYYRARWYDPQARRFISEDPIGLDGGINLYAYVGNNPINKIDPWGLLDYTVQLLGRDLPISIKLGNNPRLKEDYRKRLGWAINNINSKMPFLPPDDVRMLEKLTAIRVVTDKVAIRPFIEECTGVFTLNELYIKVTSPAFLGSAMFHDAYHVYLFELGGHLRSRGLMAEKEALEYQLRVGRILGLRQDEKDDLSKTIADPKRIEEYANTPPLRQGFTKLNLRNILSRRR